VFVVVVVVEETLFESISIPVPIECTLSLDLANVPILNGAGAIFKRIIKKKTEIKL